MFNDDFGQISAELLLLIGFILVIFILTSSFISSENELNIAILAATSGVEDGLLSDGVAIYPDYIYKEYSENKVFLLHPNDIHLVKIDYKDNGFDVNRNKTKIQFKVYVSSSQIIDKNIKDSAGDRINYNLRKSLANSFNTSSMTNPLYNPVYSDNYIFTTGDVVWV